MRNPKDHGRLLSMHSSLSHYLSWGFTRGKEPSAGRCVSQCTLAPIGCARIVAWEIYTTKRCAYFDAQDLGSSSPSAAIHVGANRHVSPGYSQSSGRYKALTSGRDGHSLRSCGGISSCDLSVEGMHRRRKYYPRLMTMSSDTSER